MKNRLLILSFFFFTVSPSLYAQARVSVNRYCMERNSALLALELINTLGKTKVDSLLDNSIRILFYFKIDKFENVTFLRSRIFDSSLGSFNHQFSDIDPLGTLSSDLKKNLQIKKGYFYICCEKVPGLSDMESCNVISKNLFDLSDYITINIPFPGSLMKFYDREKAKYKREGKTLSRYDYMRSQMNKYISLGK